MATTTAWPPGSPRWCRPISCCCCRTSTACTPPTPGATRLAAHIPVVEAVTPEIEAMGGEPPPGYSSGGMRTKLAAARIATGAGCAMAIALGHVERPLRALERRRALHLVSGRAGGAIGAETLDLGTLAPLGTLTVDAGAARALAQGRSLLPAGVRGLEGDFATWRRGGGVRPGRGPPRARPISLCQCRRRPHHRPSQRADRGDPGLARTRRDDSPRRSGAAVSRCRGARRPCL